MSSKGSNSTQPGIRSSSRKSSVDNSSESHAKAPPPGKDKVRSKSKGGNSESDLKDQEIILCPDCQKPCIDSDKAIECEFCERWFHAKCQKVSDSLYQAIVDDSKAGTQMIHWYCNSSCNFFAKKFMNNMFDLKKGLDRVTDQVEHVKRKVENIECGAMPERLQESVREIVKDELRKDEVEETLEKIESVKQFIDKQDMKNLDEKCKQFESISKFMDDKAKEQEMEMDDRQRRQTNLIIFKLPESEAVDIKDKIKEDREKVEQILDELGADNKPFFMKRLISKKEKERRRAKAADEEKGATASSDEIYASPLFMRFENQNARDEVLKKYIGAIKDAKEDDYEGEENRLYLTINIQRDMTRKEREEDLRLHNELKEKKQMSKNSNDTRAHWVRRQGRIINIGRYPRGRFDQREAQKQ